MADILKQALFLVLVQVKVWFQNRRTKHKRQKLEEESPDSQQKRKGSQHVSRWRVATQQGSPEDIDVISEDWYRTAALSRVINISRVDGALPQRYFSDRQCHELNLVCKLRNWVTVGCRWLLIRHNRTKDVSSWTAH